MLTQDSPQFQAMLANLPQVVLCVQADGTIIYMNHEEAGYSIEQVLETSIFDYVPKNVQPEFRTALDQAIQHGKTTQIEAPPWRVDGACAYYEYQFVPLVQHRGTPAALLVVTDITPHKRRENRLQESMSQNEEALSWFKLLSDQSNDAHLFVNREGKVQYVNQRACEMLQYTEQELLQKLIYDIAPGSEVRIPLFFQHMSHRVPPFEAIYLRKDGTEFPVEISVTAAHFSGTPHLCAAVRDISERKSLQQELLKSQTELRSFLENATVGMHWVGPDGIILWANQAELEMLGYDKTEYLGHNISEFHIDQPTIKDILERLSQGDILCEYPARLRCKNGSIRHVLIDSHVWFEDGEFIHTRCFTRDITDSFRARLALKKNEERLGLLLEAAQVGTWEWDLKVDKFQWSPNTYPIHGLAPGTLGDTLEAFLKMVHCEDRNLARQKLLEAQQTSQQTRFEYRLARDSDRDERWFEGVGHRLPRRNAPSSRVVGICRDITEQKRVELTLRQNDRLTAVGTLAAGLAHEINNPLSALLTSAGLAKRLLTRSDRLERMGEFLELIQSEAERIRQIVKNVVCFAKQGSSPKSVCEPRALAERAQKRIDAYAETRNVSIQNAFEENLSQVVANATELEQVLINLLSNAIDASQKGQTVLLRIVQHDKSILLSVIDQGQGMDQTDKDRLFDPFFTRKEGMGGTGLGLSIVHRIVTDHGGKIDVQSSPEAGTTMTVILPIAE